MRLSVITLLLATSIGLAFTPDIWEPLADPGTPLRYSGLLGQELCDEVVLRVRWTGDTNWVFTNSVVVNVPGVGIVTNGITNVFGGSFTQTVEGVEIKGVVPFKAEGAERLTRKFEALLPRYILPNYCTNEYWGLDSWFSNLWSRGQAYRWPGLYRKEDLIEKCGLGIVAWGTTTNTTLNPFHNIYGEINQYNTGYTNVNPVPGEPGIPIINSPHGHWIKRKDRINPLIVAEWACVNSVNGVYGFTNNFEYYRGWPNEFTSGDSFLYGLAEGQYPVYVVHLGGTNQYAGTLSLETIDFLYDGENPFWGLYPELIGSPPVAWSEWRGNYLDQVNLADDINWARWAGFTLSLATATQRSDKAWLALGVPWKLTGVSPNLQGDTVSLQYTNKMNTYEGSKVWDRILLPEQLNAHRVALTNSFLVTWTDWVWTNSVYYSNSLFSILLNIAPESSEGTYHGHILSAADNPDLTWWKSCPIVGLSDMQIPSGVEAEAQYATNDMAPFFRFTADWHIIADEEYETLYTGSSPVMDTNDMDFSWSASFTSEGWVDIIGDAVGSRMLISNLYTGTLHRAHVYLSYSDAAWSTNAAMRRVALTDWTSDAEILTGYVDPWTGINGRIGLLCDEDPWNITYDYYDCDAWVEERYEECAEISEYRSQSYGEPITYVTNIIEHTDPTEFTTTNIVWEYTSIESNMFVTNMVQVPYLVGLNYCSGNEVLTSTWDMVTYKNVSYLFDGAVLASFCVTQSMEIWEDPDYHDMRTNLVISSYPEGDGASTVRARVPDTTGVTPERDISTGDPATPRLCDRWEWLKTHHESGGMDGRYFDEPQPNDAWGNAPVSIYPIVAYCTYHSSWHNEQSSTQTYVGEYDYYVHTFLRFDGYFVYTPGAFDRDAWIAAHTYTYSWPVLGTESKSTVNTSSYTGTIVPEVKVLIEYKE